jgi:hypothetical protein
VGEFVKGMFKRFRGSEPQAALPEAPRLSMELLTRVREVTLKYALPEMPEAQAAKLADAVVGSLTLAPAG